MSSKLSPTRTRRGEGTPIYRAFIEFQAPLKRYISRFLHNAHDIEDVAQEVFLRAYNAEQGKAIEQPKPFLFRIAKHVALTQLTRKSRQITSYLGDIDESEVILREASAEDEATAHQSIGLHCEAVAELPPQCRRVYLMRKVYAMSHKEIAEHLGIAVSTVENHLTKGLAQCDRYIRERSDPGDQAAVRHKTKRRGGEQ